MTKIFDWAFFSSVDATQVSLTIKGLGIYIVPILMAGFGWDSGTAGALVSDAAALVASIITIYGLIRKIYHTIHGSNEASG